MLRAIVLLSVMLSASLPSNAQSADWYFVPVDPNTAKFDVLSKADKPFFADDPQRLWAILDPYIQTNRAFAPSSGECRNLSVLTGAYVDLPELAPVPNIESDSLVLFEFAATAATPYLTKQGDTYNKFSPVPVSVNLPEYVGIGFPKWTKGNLVFCRGRLTGRGVNDTVFRSALGSWEEPTYSGWLEDGALIVDPSSWDPIANSDLARVFQITLALLRQHDHFEYGSPGSPEDNQINDWAGAMGLLPAIALIEAEGIAGSYRGDFADPYQRPLYMPMEMDAPFIRYRSLNTADTPVDESRFSATALWWSFLKVYMDGEPSAFADRMDGLLATRRADPEMLMAVERLIKEFASESSDGLQHFIPQFAAAYANWPRTLFTEGSVDMEEWLEQSFGGCERLSVSERRVFASMTLDLREDSSRCVEFELGSDIQAFTGTYHFKLYGEPEVVDATFMAGAYRSPDLYCDVSMIRSGDCLVSLLSANLEDGTKARFQSGEAFEPKPGESQLLRSIISYVPSPGKPRGSNSETALIDIVLVLEVASIDSPLPVSDNWSTDYAGKVGSAPVGPPGDSEIVDPAAAIFDRSIGTDRSVLERGAGEADILIGLSNEDGDIITFLPDDRSALSGERTGVFDAEAVMTVADGSVTILQDPDLRSQLTILEHSEFALRFEGKANLCFIRDADREAQQAELLSEGMRIGMIDDLEARKAATKALEERLRLDDPCGAAYLRAPVKVSGSVPFPSTWTKDGMLTTWDTEAYRNMRDLRASKIRRMMAGGGLSIPRSGDSGPQPSTPAPTTPQPAPATGGPSCSVAVYSDAEGCDCSCESRACLSDRMAKDTANSSERSCRLVCGSAWSACP